MKTSTVLKQINFFIILGTIVLLPVFFLPLTSEFYDYNKQILLVVAAFVSLVIWSVSFVVDKQVRLTRSPLGLPVLALGAVWLISTIFTANKVDAFLEPGQTSTILALIILFFTTINSIQSKRQFEALISAFVISFTVLGVVTIVWSSGILPQIIPASLGFLKTSLWSPTGSPFASLVLFASALPFLVVLILKDRSKEAKAKVVLNIGTLLITVIAIALLSYRLFFTSNSSNRPVFLSQTASWSIAVKSLEASPIFGTGPATFLANFTKFRPLSYNLSESWAVRFASSSNYYLQLLSTLGLVGLVAYVFFATRVFKLVSRALKTTVESSAHAPLVASTIAASIILVCQLFVPVSVVSLAVLFFLLMITITGFKQLGSSLVHEANIDIVAASDSGTRSPILPWVSIFTVLLVILPCAYLLGRAYYAETLFQSSLVYASQNKGKNTYDTLVKTIQKNPLKDAYHMAFSQTNLLLANSIAGSKKDLSADDRNNIATLIQQAISEAKNAVSLNPEKVTNVENLAAVYRSVLSIAKGADSWTVAAYLRAIQLDPINPQLHVALGGVYYSLKNYDGALQYFARAADLKPNFANAYYNLSVTYQEKGDFQNALVNMQRVIGLVDKNTADYTKALDELEALKKKAGTNAQSTSVKPNEPAQTELEAPKTLPSPKVNPPIELPAEAGPSTTSPTPSPKATTTPIPTP